MTHTRASIVEALYAAAAFLLKAVTDPVVVEAAPLNHRVAALNTVGRMLHRLDEKPTDNADKQQDSNTTFVWDYGPEYDVMVVERDAPALGEAIDHLEHGPAPVAVESVDKAELQKIAAAAAYLFDRSTALSALHTDAKDPLLAVGKSLREIAIIFRKYAKFIIDGTPNWPPLPTRPDTTFPAS